MLKFMAPGRKQSCPQRSPVLPWALLGFELLFYTSLFCNPCLGVDPRQTIIASCCASSWRGKARSHLFSVWICRGLLGQESSKWEPGAHGVWGLALVVCHRDREVSHLSAVVMWWYFPKPPFFQSDAMCGAGVQAEGSAKLRLALAVLLTVCSRETAFWWLPFIICKMGIIITYVTGVLQDLIN